MARLVPAIHDFRSV